MRPAFLRHSVVFLCFSVVVRQECVRGTLAEANALTDNSPWRLFFPTDGTNGGFCTSQDYIGVFYRGILPVGVAVLTQLARVCRLHLGLAAHCTAHDQRQRNCAASLQKVNSHAWIHRESVR